MAYNKAVLAQLNKKIVLDMIRTKGPINKAEIARIAGLSIPTVMKITDEFERQRLIRSIGKGESTGGKRPDMLEFVNDAFYVAGVDIGRHNVKIVLIDMAAEILESRCIPTTEEDVKEPEAFLDRIAGCAEQLINSRGIPQSRMMGIGIGMPGILDYEKGSVIFSPDFDWMDIPLRELFQQRFPYKVVVENSNRALALGEYTYGAAKGADYFFCINLGYGIGAAIGEKGELLYGKSGTCGEFGHMTLEPEGPVCDCGNRGCLEALASGNAIAKKMEAELRSGRKSIAAEKIKPKQRIEAKHVFDAARKKDALSMEIMDNAIEYLGIAIAGSINLLDPELVIIAGGLMKSSDLFMDRLEQSVSNHKMKHSARNVKIKKGILGTYGTAIGAASLLIRDFLENGGEYLSV